MAGMLPGVECARRRRFHQGGSMEPPTGSRRSSFCLYRSGHESHLCTSSTQRSTTASSKSFQSEALGSIAREAKERLDERLRTQRTSQTIQSASQIRRHNSTGSLRPVGRNRGGGGEGAGSGILADLHREVFYTKKSSRKFSWSKLGRRASDQDECVVCLEDFKAGDILVHLPCAHRFHWRCMVPWLEKNSHCPCCRMEISS